MHTTRDAYARLAGDPRLQARFRRAYRGRHDPMDAAWWAAHPGEVAPSGALPPDALRAAVLAEVFSREGSADRASSDALVRLDEQLADDDRALVAALAEAEPRGAAGRDRAAASVHSGDGPDGGRDDGTSDHGSRVDSGRFDGTRDHGSREGSGDHGARDGSGDDGSRDDGNRDDDGRDDDGRDDDGRDDGGRDDGGHDDGGRSGRIGRRSRAGHIVPGRRALIVGAAAILVVGALAGSAVGWLAGGEGAGRAAGSDRAGTTGHETSSPSSAPGDPLSAFSTTVTTGSQRFQNPDELARPQQSIDRPSVPIPSSFSPKSFRITAGYSDDRLMGKLKVYFARDTSGHTCVVVVTAAKSLNSDCISPRYFPASGVNLVWSDASGSGYLLWLRDGSLSYGYSPPGG